MNHSKRQAGQRGGQATFARHGPEHMRTIGKRGAAAFHKRYHLAPAGMNDFAIVDRQTGQVKAYTSGRWKP